MQPPTGPIIGGIFLGVIVLYAAFLLTRLYLQRRDRKRRLNDPELARRAAEGKTLAVPSEKPPQAAVDHEEEADEAVVTIPGSSESPESPHTAAAPSATKHHDEAIQ